VSLFVDTSAFFAVADGDDAHHRPARGTLSAGEPLVTSDHVLVETWLLIGRRLGHPAADAFWQGLRRGAARVEPVTSADVEVAWTIGRDFPDQTFSIVDRTCFAVMERMGITRVATFDRHFAIYRFGPGRREAFEVVR
jgi:predicted nucleic acid-binding protein